MRKPSPQEIEAARGKRMPDVIAPGLRVLFVGINPSLYSAAVRHHFARPGNRFWPTLQRSGFTERRLSPDEDRTLLSLGLGLTNVAWRATARADELDKAELIRGGRTLERKVRRYRPRCVAILGVTAYRAAFDKPQGQMGPQSRKLSGALLWVLPNPSGLNAHYPPQRLAEVFRAFRETLPG